jgi:bifunctional enzyme Fae/Hps
MSSRTRSLLDPKKRYLQVALNNTLEDARRIIAGLPVSDRIIVEAGTPFIKRYGEDGIRQVRAWYEARLSGLQLQDQQAQIEISPGARFILTKLLGVQIPETKRVGEVQQPGQVRPYIVADLKAMDRGETEVELAARAGASAATALGSAPIETLNSFIAACEACGIDAMIDMMNVPFPLTVLRALKKVPPVVSHRNDTCLCYDLF